MVAPLVAVVARRLQAGRITNWRHDAFAAQDSYVSALQRAGARPALLAANDPAPPEEVLAPFDGLLLMGGGDIDPARYGADRHPRVYGVDPDRDTIELALVRRAVATGLPLFAICRGAQVVNVAFGGTLHQHLADLEGVAVHGEPLRTAPVPHSVKVAPGSLLADVLGDGEVESCTSLHHQGIDRLGDGLVPVAWAEDGLVEAVEPHPDLLGPGWVAAVQWHPEETAGHDRVQQALFDRFAEAARARRRPRPAG